MLIRYFAALFIYILFTLPYVVSARAMLNEKEIKEYGIAIVPENICFQKAADLNKIITSILHDLPNVSNHWHITLFQGVFKTTDIINIEQTLKALPIKPFNLLFTKIYVTENRWIDYGIKKSEYLQQLHEEVIKIAAYYHKHPLKRYRDIYDSLPNEKRIQVDKYGMSGILEHYTPHMSLFYQYPPHNRLSNIPVLLIAKYKASMKCKAHEIIIGELGYNGNITKIISLIKIPQ